jgi:hypothetical protein
MLIKQCVSRTRAQARGAVPKMGDGLPKSACRSRLQTARVLLRSKGVVVSDPGKVVLLGQQVSVEKMSESKPSDDASLSNQGAVKTGVDFLLQE